MSVKEVDRATFDRWVDGLIENTRVIGVQAKQSKEERFEFRPLESAADLRLDYDVTIIPQIGRASCRERVCVGV